MQERSEVLSTDEAADYLKHSKRTMIRWRMARIGPKWIKCGRKVLYRRDSLDAWLDKREQTPVREVA